MDSSSDIYLNTNRKYNCITSSKFYINKTKDSCYIIVGLLAMYVGIYMIFSSGKILN